MFRIAISVGWQTPILPNWNDRTPGGEFTRRNFYRWLISAGMDRGGGGGSLLSWGLLGFYLTLYVTDFWSRKSGEQWY